MPHHPDGFSPLLEGARARHATVMPLSASVLYVSVPFSKGRARATSAQEHAAKMLEGFSPLLEGARARHPHGSEWRGFKRWFQSPSRRGARAPLMIPGRIAAIHVSF